MLEDFERCYRAVASRDPRFDGWFVTGVTTTGIYCRPSCPAVTPRRDNVRFYPSAAAAQLAGFRACLRCRPDAAPGSPEWNTRADVVGRAMRLIADGAVDRHGVAGLAARLGYSQRQLHRVLVAEVGSGAAALARARRAQTARMLVEATNLPVAHIAFAAGFTSVRQCNDTFRQIFARTPTEVRRVRATGGTGGTGGAAGGGVGEVGPGSVTLRLAHRLPFDAPGVLGFLARRAVPGIEGAVDGTYHRSLRLPHGAAVVGLAPLAGHVGATLRLEDLRDLATAVSRCRHLLDLDADPVAVDATLGADPALRPLVAAVPGRRVPHTTDGFELAVRAVVGQQISVAGARTVVGRLVAAAGTPLGFSAGPVTHLFPTAADLLAADTAAFAMPAARRRALLSLARAVTEGTLVLDAGAEPDALSRGLCALPGIGPWTAAYVAMRALGDPDAFPAGDLGVRRALSAPGRPASPAAVLERAGRWRPWRAYAVMHLWEAGTAGGAAAAQSGHRGEDAA